MRSFYCNPRKTSVPNCNWSGLAFWRRIQGLPQFVLSPSWAQSKSTRGIEDTEDIRSVHIKFSNYTLLHHVIRQQVWWKCICSWSRYRQQQQQLLAGQESISYCGQSMAPTEGQGMQYLTRSTSYMMASHAWYVWCSLVMQLLTLRSLCWSKPVSSWPTL